MGEKLGKSPSSVARALKKLGLKTKRGTGQDEDGFRRCRDCGTRKPVNDFVSAGIIKGVEYYRRLCVQCYSKSKVPRRERLREDYKELKRNLRCCECGNEDPRVLDFDHLDPSQKEFDISNAYYKVSWERLKAEIDKCQVLCANCHRIKTWEDREKQNRAVG
jgi:hypothetical protein